MKKRSDNRNGDNKGWSVIILDVLYGTYLKSIIMVT